VKAESERQKGLRPPASDFQDSATVFRFFPPPTPFRPWAKAGDYRKATQRVYHSVKESSFIELPLAAR
jgi:hypothetical protein